MFNSHKNQSKLLLTDATISQENYFYWPGSTQTRWGSLWRLQTVPTSSIYRTKLQRIWSEKGTGGDDRQGIKGWRKEE